MADPARLPDPLHLGVQPQIRVGALKGSLAEYGDLFVQAAAQPADGVLAHRLQPQLLDQPVDLAGRDAVDIGLLHDRDQRLLGPPARLQKARDVRPGPQLRDGQLQLTDPGVPAARPVAVTLGLAAIRGTLTQPGAGQPADLGLHQLGDQPGHAVAQHVGVLVCQQLVDQVGSGHPVALGHRVCLLRRSLDRPTIMRHAVADSYSGSVSPAALLHHHLRLDPSGDREGHRVVPSPGGTGPSLWPSTLGRSFSCWALAAKGR